MIEANRCPRSANRTIDKLTLIKLSHLPPRSLAFSRLAETGLDHFNLGVGTRIIPKRGEELQAL